MESALKVDNNLIQVSAMESILLEVGTSKITIKPDKITIEADSIDILGKNTFVKGDRVDINE
ncbi:hypothetical protein [Pseudomonas juntendi]|uniref:hypothetical protein n=1 Tax=Pseudomonas juntendi TaxID=2666183 RepID=UPI002174E84C